MFEHPLFASYLSLNSHLDFTLTFPLKVILTDYHVTLHMTKTATTSMLCQPPPLRQQQRQQQQQQGLKTQMHLKPPPPSLKLKRPK